MPFNWNDYLVIAEAFKTKTDGLPQSSANEAMQRTAMSRAYYAVYHLAEDFAKENFGYIPSQYGHNQHHANIRLEYMKQSGSPDHQEVQKMLARLHKARIDSDYKSDDLGNMQALLTSVILEANKIKGILTR